MTTLSILLNDEASAFGGIAIIFIFVWLLLCFLVALTGSGKPIGYWGVFFLSLLLSPLIGLIIGLVSASKPTVINVNTNSGNAGAGNTDNIVQDLTTKAIKLFLANDLDAALALLKRAVTLQPLNNKLYYNLACLYSTKKDINNCLASMQIAIENGYSDFNKINTYEKLAWMRNHELYKIFVANGYCISLTTNKSQTTEETKSIDHSKIEALERLSNLKEKGMLTNEEFAEEKRKILL